MNDFNRMTTMTNSNCCWFTLDRMSRFTGCHVHRKHLIERLNSHNFRQNFSTTEWNHWLSSIGIRPTITLYYPMCYILFSYKIYFVEDPSIHCVNQCKLRTHIFDSNFSEILQRTHKCVWIIWSILFRVNGGVLGTMRIMWSDNFERSINR